MTTIQFLADAATSTTQGTKPPPPTWYQALGQFFPFILIGAFLILLMSRSKKNQDKERTAMLAKLKKGDEIQTIGGILGKVMEAREDRVLVKVDENSNTKMWFSRNAIHKVIGTEAESK